jgi:hypothetical protein
VARHTDPEALMPNRPHHHVALVGLAALLAGCSAADTTSPLNSSAQEATTTGNGGPSGAHYNLNIIGVDNGKNPNMAGSGNVIFVGLGTKKNTVTTNILLNQSTDGSFGVLDKNGTDGEASFELPAPGGYTVWARALGAPGDSAKITTCASDVAGNGIVADTVCSTENQVFVRGTGKSTFRDVTQALTTIVIDALSESAAFAACGGNNQTSIRVNLFDPCLEGYFWRYDNNGLRLLQIRFYKS